MPLIPYLSFYIYKIVGRGSIYNPKFEYYLLKLTKDYSLDIYIKVKINIIKFCNKIANCFAIDL